MQWLYTKSSVNSNDYYESPPVQINDINSNSIDAMQPRYNSLLPQILFVIYVTAWSIKTSFVTKSPVCCTYLCGLNYNYPREFTVNLNLFAVIENLLYRGS